MLRLPEAWARLSPGRALETLIHLIYCSAAARPFGRGELRELLGRARQYNERHGITGMLLYAEGSFFQVLEGAPDEVERLYARISRDSRHERIVRIIREPLAARCFGEWSMGCPDLATEALDEIVGANDFFTSGHTFLDIGEGRAKKLLAAFRDGRWRNALAAPVAVVGSEAASPVRRPLQYAFAYQPIVHAPTRSIHSYEALIRGPAGEPAASVLEQLAPLQGFALREEQRIAALESAARLGLSTRLNINFLPSDISHSPTAITSVLETAEQCGVPCGAIVLEVLESEIIRDSAEFSARMNAYRASGVSFAIDDFGAGYAGLNLLAEFQPDLIKTDMGLVRGIEGNGPRQAILRGIIRTCQDLGIDVIAEGVETAEEYAWLRREGIELFQGFLIAPPMFGGLPVRFHLPDRAPQA
jgi:EAL domain-containing protein (putative c-di-GMP-specific phosphodiesterase class I)